MKKIRYLSVVLLFSLISFSIIQLPLFSLLQTNQSGEGNPLREISPKRATPPDLTWWNVSWWYRKVIRVESSSLSRSDSLFEAWFNFTDILQGELNLLGKSFDNNSVRIIEYNEASGDPIVHNSTALKYPTTKYEVPFSLWYDATYNILTNARVKISWVLNGTTLAMQNRTYSVYFDTTDHGLKEAPVYWVTQALTLAASESIRSTSNTQVSPNLWSIRSSNLSVYVSEITGTDATLQGQPTRLHYIAGGSTISDYRINYALMDYSQVMIGGTAQNINLASLRYQDNKIVIPKAYSTSNYHMNITYEVFENSVFTKVTYSFYTTLPVASFEIRWHGDLSANPTNGNDVNSQRFRDSEGDSYTGNPGKIIDPGNAPSWVVFDDTGPGHNDLLGVIIPDASPHFQFQKNGRYVYDLWGYIPDMVGGNYQEFSYYLVTTPKGVSSFWSPVEDLCKDLVITPKQYTEFNAEAKTTSIIVTVLDSDGFIVPNAQVYLNASADLNTALANKTTDESGICTFSNLNGGDYNFSVSLCSASGTQKISVNGSTKTYQDVTNLVQLNASIWGIQFDVKDKDGMPLQAGWISINHSIDGSYSLHNLTLSNGLATFRWENNSDYNYTVFYSVPSYNAGVPIVVNSSIITQQDHTVGVPTIVTINTALTKVNFTVLDNSLDPISSAVIRVFNSSLSDGTPDTSDILTDLVPTDVNGTTQFYWLNRADGSNYSLYINVGGDFNTLPLNTTDAADEWTSLQHYQNFTMMDTINKTIIVKLEPETAVYLTAELISVNNPFATVYWGEKITFQVLYQHNTTQGFYVYATPSVLHYTLKFNENVLVGPADMSATSQGGRFEALVDTAALGLVPGNTYSIKIEAEEGGYQPITPLWYWIQVKSLPTTLSATPNQVTGYWGDIARTQVEYQTDYPNEIAYAYAFLNSSDQDFTFSIPRIQNVWNLTEVQFNFTEIVSGGSWMFGIYKGGSEVKTITNPTTVTIVSGPWLDDNLTFSILGTGGVTSFKVTARCVYARTGVKFNQTIMNINGDSTLEVDTPGPGWKLTGLVAAIWGVTGNIGDLKNLSIGMYNVEHLISGTNNIYQNLNYYLDPLRNYLNLTFSNTSAVTFNANFSLIFAPVANRHDLAETDIITYTALAPTGTTNIDLSSDKMWDIDSIDLQFSGFRNGAYELIDPAAIGLNVTYLGVNYSLSGAPGYFSVNLDSPAQLDILAFSLSTGDISAYNLTVIQSYRWVNYWGVQGGTVSYYVFSNSSITGNAIENSTSPSIYDLAFFTSRTSVGSQILRISASFPANHYGTATFDLPLLIQQIPTTVNGSQVFYWNRQIYKTEAQLFYTEYYDTHNLRGITGATATFIVGYYSPGRENEDTADWVDTGFLSEVSLGIYMLDYDTENLAEGTYKFAINLATENGAYEPRHPTLTLKIDLIPGNLTLFTPLILSRIQRETATYSFQLSDNRTTHAGEIYPQPLTSVSVAFALTSGTFDLANLSWINGTGDGIFNLTVNTRAIFPGTYVLRVTFSRENYTVLTQEVTLSVTAFQPTLVIPASVQVVTVGDVAQIQISVSDGLKGMTFTGIQIDWEVVGTTLSGSLTTVSPTGSYTLSIPTETLPANTNYNIEITISVTVEEETYVLSQVSTINLRVDYATILGIPVPYFWAMIIAVGVVIGIFILYRSVLRARIPEMIKQIERTFADIKKSRTLGSIAIASSKENQYAERFAADWQVIGVDQPWKEQKSDQPAKERNPQEVEN